MKSVTIQNKPFLLKGETIQAGKKLNFSALDRNAKKIDISNLKMPKIISVFPDINTSVCDAQTIFISKMAQQSEKVKFISITMDAPEIIEKWCVNKAVNNLLILSDAKYQEFAQKTNLFIPKINKLTRAFLYLDENNIIQDISINQEIVSEPDYEFVKNICKI